MAARLAALLDEVIAAGPGVAPARSDGLVADLREAFDEAASAALAGVDAERLPLRLTKDRIARVLACEAHAVAERDAGEPFTLSEPVVRGRVLDRLLHHHVHGGGVAAPGPALAVAEGAFEAERDDAVVEWLLDDPDRRVRVADDATAFAESLVALGPVDPDWWPRCEERLRVDAGDGAIRCTAQLDLVVGGRPTERPMVVVEVKSGRFGQDHRDGLFWYALLATLRHGAAPAAVIGWSAWDGSAWCQPVTEVVLQGAVDRAADALVRFGELERGRLPTRTPSRACTWCPERDTCPVADPSGGDDDA
jgi:hypothetical protein